MTKREVYKYVVRFTLEEEPLDFTVMANSGLEVLKKMKEEYGERFKNFTIVRTY